MICWSEYYSVTQVFRSLAFATRGSAPDEKAKLLLLRCNSDLRRIKRSYLRGVYTLKNARFEAKNSADLRKYSLNSLRLVAKLPTNQIGFGISDSKCKHFRVSNQSMHTPQLSEMAKSYPEFYDHVQANMTKYGKERPDTMSGFMQLRKGGSRDGALSAKVKS